MSAASGSDMRPTVSDIVGLLLQEGEKETVAKSFQIWEESGSRNEKGEASPIIDEMRGLSPQDFDVLIRKDQIPVILTNLRSFREMIALFELLKERLGIDQSKPIVVKALNSMGTNFSYGGDTDSDAVEAFVRCIVETMGLVSYLPTLRSTIDDMEEEIGEVFGDDIDENSDEVLRVQHFRAAIDKIEHDVRVASGVEDGLGKREGGGGISGAKGGGKKRREE
jgi:hypothetical protein